MRLTRTVKDYIEEEVHKKYDKKIESLRKDLRLLEDDISAIFEEEIVAARERVYQRVKNEISPEGLICWYSKTPARVKDIFEHSGYNSAVTTPDVISLINHIDNLRKEADRKVTDIIVELELGGTKDDLMRILNEINVD